MNLYHIFVSYFSSGGELMIPIFLVSLVAWYLSLEKVNELNEFYRFRKRYLRNVRSLLKGEKPKYDSVGYYAYDLLLDEVKALKSGEKRNSEILFKEFLISAVPDVRKRLTTISTWTSVAPLLGLLGTVTGMIATFKVITDFGLGNPGLTAQGISVALLTTQAGLTVAFPMVIMHNHLANRSNYLVDKLMLDGEDLINKLESDMYRGKIEASDTTNGGDK